MSTTVTLPTPLVTTKFDPMLMATILADGAGMTLYTHTNSDKPVACVDVCARLWPPLELPLDMRGPTGSMGVPNKLGIGRGPNGGQLVTFGALPLYRFSKDHDAADVFGEGVQSFGGTWHVVRIEPAPIPP